ncbi:unnamed protein product [Vitrella brassicaformis CCMP3155]|uniref:TLDc domain-containing protein n=2 Tax=Vitrella brassicaformis TaxID=1169539 RepID=A0A0G4EUL0_VITBC|nr:unnamed protein product [Vitrella brassicaformis CCMP3155]|eukprot:CEM01911.1 unnamed protein product [Vitrella brassicaformis CCMP3155]
MSAAAAVADGRKKRKNHHNGVADESVAPSRLHGVTSGREDADVLLKEISGCMDGLRGAVKTAAAAAEGKTEKLAGEIKQMITSNGGTVYPQQTSGKLKLNVGGTVLSIPVSSLLQPKVKRTFLSTLLLHFTDALPKDTNKVPYLEMHPPYFRWLRNQLALLESPHISEIKLLPPKSDDPSHAEYHSLFMQKLGSDIEEQPQAPSTSAAAAAAAAAGGNGEMADAGGGGSDELILLDDSTSEEESDEGGEGGAREAFREIDQYVRRYKGLVSALRKQKEKMEAFLSAMRPFVKGESSDEDVEVMTLSVNDEDVSVLRRTVAPLGAGHALVKRYDKDKWPDQDVHQTSDEFLQLIVDFARRLTCIPDGRFVHPPVVAQHDKEIFAVELGMYGLSTVPTVVGGAAEASTVIRTADEWLQVMKMTNKKIAVPPSLLYKGSRDTYVFPKMLECVESKSGLLFALRDGDTHRFGCFIDGPLTPPDDPTDFHKYKVPVFFYSLSGAYDAPTKIEPPEGRQRATWQRVTVAGTQGAVKDCKGEPTANVSIACGRLWLGYADPGPAADLSSCQQGIEKKHLLAAGEYRGKVKHGDGPLAQQQDFTCSEMEVWHIKEVVSG